MRRRILRLVDIPGNEGICGRRGGAEAVLDASQIAEAGGFIRGMHKVKVAVRVELAAAVLVNVVLLGLAVRAKVAEVDALLAQHKVAAEVVDVLEGVQAEQLGDHRLPSNVAQEEVREHGQVG